MDWDRVRRALRKYPNIGKSFSLQDLQESAPPPYFCHGMAWRLNIWEGIPYHDNHLRLLDLLLRRAERLAGWDSASRLADPRYDAFWSQVWELQVAEAFDRHNEANSVEWLRRGPDLKVLTSGGQCFVECYVYMKSYAAEHYIRDLLWHIDAAFRVEHVHSVPLLIPEDPLFYHELFEPLLCHEHLEGLRLEAQKHGRAKVCVPGRAKNLRIYLEHPRTPPPPDLNNAHGAGAYYGEGFVDDALTKVVSNKERSNALAQNRPNVLLVNCLLARDFTLDLDITLDRFGGLPDEKFRTASESAIDALAFYSWGVDQRLDLACCETSFRDRSGHPVASLLG